jgi:hypothetical protein
MFGLEFGGISAAGVRRPRLRVRLPSNSTYALRLSASCCCPYSGPSCIPAEKTFCLLLSFPFGVKYLVAVVFFQVALFAATNETISQLI